jgi:hypothetical protein
LKWNYGRIARFAKLSVLCNTALALGKIGMGVYSLSVFLCINGLYTLGLALARIISLRGYYKQEEHRAYFYTGITILVSALLYMLYCVKLLTDGQNNIQYTEIVALAIATVTFTEIGIAVHGVITARRSKKPFVEALKLTNFVSSLISLVLTQTAIMSFTYSGTGSITFYCGVSGIVFSALSTLTGLGMILSHSV